MRRRRARTSSPQSLLPHQCARTAKPIMKPTGMQRRDRRTGTLQMGTVRTDMLRTDMPATVRLIQWACFQRARPERKWCTGERPRRTRDASQRCRRSDEACASVSRSSPRWWSWLARRHACVESSRPSAALPERRAACPAAGWVGHAISAFGARPQMVRCRRSTQVHPRVLRRPFQSRSRRSRARPHACPTFFQECAPRSTPSASACSWARLCRCTGRHATDFRCAAGVLVSACARAAATASGSTRLSSARSRCRRRCLGHRIRLPALRLLRPDLQCKVRRRRSRTLSRCASPLRRPLLPKCRRVRFWSSRCRHRRSKVRRRLSPQVLAPVLLRHKSSPAGRPQPAAPVFSNLPPAIAESLARLAGVARKPG